MRPKLVHFLAIKNKDSLNIRASLALKENELMPKSQMENLRPTNPWQNIGLLIGANEFRLKLIGLDDSRDEIFTKEIESDSRGNFNFKIPITNTISKISALQVYETQTYPGLEVNLGTIIPLEITPPSKLVISDFDKTLVDTKYSSTKEVYHSLTKPLGYFPTVQESVDLFKSYIAKGYHPFILSASPHFYENPIREWLYSNQIFTAGIFLKDYRLVFNFLQSELTTKDIKVQGLYKLNHLLDIILMAGIPEDLVLMGDNYESDPVIYLTLASLLQGEIEPWTLWNKVRKLESFQLNNKQNGQFLNKLYQVKSSLNQKVNSGEPIPKLKIYIRKTKNDDAPKHIDSFEELKSKIEMYDVHINQKVLKDPNNPLTK